MNVHTSILIMYFLYYIHNLYIYYKIWHITLLNSITLTLKIRVKNNEKKNTN